MRYCNKCGSKLKESENYCPFCGSNFSKAQNTKTYKKYWLLTSTRFRIFSIFRLIALYAFVPVFTLILLADIFSFIPPLSITLYIVCGLYAIAIFIFLSPNFFDYLSIEDNKIFKITTKWGMKKQCFKISDVKKVVLDINRLDQNRTRVAYNILLLVAYNDNGIRLFSIQDNDVTREIFKTYGIEVEKY